MSDDIECIDRPIGAAEGKPWTGNGKTTLCTGRAELRESLTGTGTPIPRCDGHWSERLDREQELRQRYPEHAPPDFDPMAAGERWNEDDPWP